MSRRFALVPFLLLALVTGAAERPNILFVLIDDLGYGDFSCTGNREVHTPHIDRLTSQGVLLSQFHVNSPICSPSRVAFTTGQYPQRWNIHSFLSGRAANKRREMPNFLDTAAPSIARVFKDAGYATAHFGKWHMGGGRDVGDAPLPQAYGFDESLTSFEGLGDRILPPGELGDQSAKLGSGNITRVEKHEQTAIYVDRTIDFMRRNTNSPFYIHLWLNDVHDPFFPAPGATDAFAGKGRHEEDRKFFAVLAEMDRQLGRLFQALDSLGLAQRTMVVLTGDNGPTAWPRYYKEGIEPPGSTAGDRGRKWSLYQGGIRQPLIIRWPGTVPAGIIDDSSFVVALDFFPSFTRIAGINMPAGKCDGEDMSRALLGKPTARKRPVMWEYRHDIKPGDPRDVSPELAIREGDWKLLMNRDGSSPELYNMAQDRAESRNLAESQPRRVKSMSTQLLKWREDVLAKSPQTSTISLRPNEYQHGQWGLTVSGAGLATAYRRHPVELEFWSATGQITNVFAAYDHVTPRPGGFTGRANVTGPDNSRFLVTDDWVQGDRRARLSRKIKVTGTSSNGFMSGFQFDFVGARTWPEVQWFAPGMIYGGFENLNPAAIGGSKYYEPGNYTVRIREDRCPAPVFLAHFADDTSLTILNGAPRGGTTAFEGMDIRAVPLMNTNFQFGAIGAQERDGKLSVGYWFPGSEGQVTYAGNTYPGGQLHEWRRRYHPIEDGWVQQYEIQFQFGEPKPFPDSMAAAWRWAWNTLNPHVEKHDIAAARRVLTDMLAANVVRKGGRTGIPFSIDAVTGSMETADRRAIMGFCGKNLEAVNYLLQEAALEPGPRSDTLRKTAEEIAGSFVRLRMSPPEGEGWNIDDGTITCARRKEQIMYLRPLGDDTKMLLQAYEREKRLGREHPEWLAWCREFADWLLPQQRADGGFPRSWHLGSAEVASASPNSSFNAVPLLVHLSRITGESKYLDAAERAARFCWNNGQSRGRFVGGTIDNPDVLDKEAATISLEAYLALYETTRDPQWLECAKSAANYAQTWIYIWNVPMPYDDSMPNRHWKRGVSTVGVQLIATGHSLVDAYMCFDADDYAKLYKYTGDPHYYEVARLLLHSTKSMLALPGRTYDLVGPGWQQEHWSMAPRRGQGLHRRWLPWVSTSHLNAIFGLMNFDRDLYDKLSRAEELK